MENAQENAIVNGVEDKVSITLCDLDSFSGSSYDLLVANLISGVIKSYAAKFAVMLRPGADAVFSGILAVEESQIRDALTPAGFLIEEVWHADEWITFKAKLK